MQVTLKLFATLSDYLPPGASKNTVPREVGDGVSVRELLASTGVPMEKCHLILVNGVYVAPAKAADKRLAAGDTVSVWPPVAGG